MSHSPYSMEPHRGLGDRGGQEQWHPQDLQQDEHLSSLVGPDTELGD